MKLVILGVALLCATQVAAAAEPLPFGWTKPIQVQVPAPDTLIMVPLDRDVYRRTGLNLPDLRITTGDGSTVPYLLRKRVETKVQKTYHRWRVSDPALRPTDDGGIEISLQLGPKDEQPDGLTVFTPLRDFEQRVQVYGTVPGEQEQLLVKDALLFDYSRYMDVSRREIRLPKNTARSLRIVMGATSVIESELQQEVRRQRGDGDVEQKQSTERLNRAFRIDFIELWSEHKRDAHRSDVEATYPVAISKTRQDKETKTTIIELTSQREPLVSVTLKTNSRNFGRPARVEIEHTHGVRTEWRTIGQATVSHIDLPGVHEEHLQITFPETREEKYRIVIENRDSHPLDVTDVEASGHVYDLLYFAGPDLKYQLHFGAEDADAPKYDLAALQIAVNQDLKAVEAQLGPESDSDGAGPPGLNAKVILNNPIVLGVAICVLVALLGFGLYQASRRVGQLPPEEPHS